MCEHKYLSVPLPAANSLEEIETCLGQVKWSMDGPLQLFDAISYYPQATWVCRELPSALCIPKGTSTSILLQTDGRKKSTANLTSRRYPSAGFCLQQVTPLSPHLSSILKEGLQYGIPPLVDCWRDNLDCHVKKQDLWQSNRLCGSTDFCNLIGRLHQSNLHAIDIFPPHHHCDRLGITFTDMVGIDCRKVALVGAAEVTF